MRFRLYVLSAICVVWMWGCSTQKRNEQSPAISEERQRLLRELGAKVQRQPRNVRLRLQYAEALANAGDCTPALQQVDTVVQQKPDDTSALLARSRMLFRLGRPRDAERETMKILKADPRNFAAQLVLAWSYFDQKLYEEAESIFLSVVEKDSSGAHRESAYRGLEAVCHRRAKNCYEEGKEDQARNYEQRGLEYSKRAEVEGLRRRFWPAPLTDKEYWPGKRKAPRWDKIGRAIEDMKRDRP